MKFQKYLTEMYDPGMDDDIGKSIAQKLKEDCTPFIKEMKSNNLHNWFYRATEHGWNFISPPIKPRKDRRPRNTPKEYMDKLFKKKFGWKARSEGVFVSTDRNQIEYVYGDPYLFFPMGNYKYIYHPQIDDLYQKMDDDYKLSYLGKDIDDVTYIEILQFLDKTIPQYKDKNLGEAYRKIVEVSFKCKSYYMVNEKYSNLLKKYLEW